MDIVGYLVFTRSKRMKIKETSCYGCQECVGCGRKYEEWSYHKCDRCGSTEQLYYSHDGEELCVECILEDLEKVDMEE